MMDQSCLHCEYAWQSRVESPKSCPRCKQRLDYYKLQDDFIVKD